MKELIRYELKKTLSSLKFIVIFVSVVLLCVAIFIFNRGQADYEYVKEIQSYYSGEVTEGEVAKAVARHRELYEKKNTIGLSQAEEEEFYSLEEPVWLNRCDEVRKQVLSEYGIKPQTLIIGDTISYGFMENFISTYLPLIMCFLISFLIGSVFSSEYESKMDGLLLATKNGKRKVILAKFISSVVITAGLYVMIMLVYMIFVVAVYGFSETNVSFVFTAGEPYKYLISPFDFTVLQYSLTMLAVSLFGCIAYTVFALFVSSKCKRSVLSSMICMTAGYIPFFAYLMIANEESAITNILRFTYSQIISVRTLFTMYSTVGIGNAEIQTVYAALVTMCVLSVAFSVITYKVFRKHQVTN